MHQAVEEQLGVEESLPCADFALLVPLKRSTEYRAIRSRLADPHHVDSWQQEGFHFFVFALRAGDDANHEHVERPVAVFAMSPDDKKPFSAVVVTPRSNGARAEVTDLREPANTYIAPVQV